MFQSLARLKDDFCKTKIGGSSPDVSTLSLLQEKSTTASQTDLRGEVNNLLHKTIKITAVNNSFFV